MKEERKLTQRVVNEILTDVTELCTDIVSNLQEFVEAELNITMDDLPKLKEVFDELSVIQSHSMGWKVHIFSILIIKKIFK